MCSEYLSIKEALGLLFKACRPQPREEELLVKQALGRVLAEEVRASHDIPPYDASHMDGFAVRSEDLSPASPRRPIRLRLKGQVRLGEVPGALIGPGEAMAVPTGGYLPPGADAVVPLEDARLMNDYIEVTRPVQKGDYVYRRGSTIARGQLAFVKGHALRPQDVGLLLALRKKAVRVFRRPEVTLLPVGGELTDEPEAEPQKMPNSHAWLLAGMLELLGCAAKVAQIVPDELSTVAGALERELRKSDMVFTISGSSVGQADLVKRAIAELGRLNEIVRGLKLDPGRRGGFAVAGGKPIFVLPGLILGAMNVLLVLALPLLEAMGSLSPPRLPAKLAEPWEAKRRPDFTKVVYVKVERDGSSLLARPVLGETEKLTVLTQANGCLIVPEDVTRLDEGRTVEVMLLPGFHLTTPIWHEMASRALGPQTSIQ